MPMLQLQPQKVVSKLQLQKVESKPQLREMLPLRPQLRVLKVLVEMHEIDLPAKTEMKYELNKAKERLAEMQSFESWAHLEHEYMFNS